MAEQDKLARQAKQREKAKKEIRQVKNAYKEWSKTNSYKDLDKWLESESASLMRDAKNRYSVIQGKLIPLDSGMVESLVYKSAGLDMARQYIKQKLD